MTVFKTLSSNLNTLYNQLAQSKHLSAVIFTSDEDGFLIGTLSMLFVIIHDWLKMNRSPS